eukprot:CAMPEP_0183728916 /NCGR_PEP_ID=MMETSP0737-20130205/29245_1 /TAXON_ID=385413 /ORGANISM="Thalassiosira miniscula, Strain CCMP1093" /LENGTH=123 /DNA_ID=CAMNT_0025960987 /DNA_START=302 /DNA_END=673 /DNA_ORIENTATION=+
MNLPGYLYVNESIETKGCFYKNDHGYFGLGGTQEEMSEPDLPGIRTRIWCNADTPISTSSVEDGEATISSAGDGERSISSADDGEVSISSANNSEASMASGMLQKKLRPAHLLLGNLAMLFLL